MWKWRWSRGGKPTAIGRAADDSRLALEKQAQGLRLELGERDRALADLRRQLEQLQAGERDRLAQALKAQMERVLAASATRIAQLNTQGYLIDVEGKPVAARDVLASARG